MRTGRNVVATADVTCNLQPLFSAEVKIRHNNVSSQAGFTANMIPGPLICRFFLHTLCVIQNKEWAIRVRNTVGRSHLSRLLGRRFNVLPELV